MGPFLVACNILLLLGFAACANAAQAPAAGPQGPERVVEYALTAVCMSEDARGLQALIQLQTDGLLEYGPSFEELVLHVR